MCLMVAKLAGALSRRMRHSSCVARLRHDGEHHVHHPVVALDTPMTANGLPLTDGVGCKRGDIEARFLLGFSVGKLAATLDHDEALQAHPVMTLLEPIDVAD